MPPMSVTLEVPQFERSRVVNEEQPEKTRSMLVTELVLKPLISKLVSDEQP